MPPPNSKPFTQVQILVATVAAVTVGALIFNYTTSTAKKSPAALHGTSIKEAAGNLKGAKSYDYVIIGGGTAGCVLARRLSEDPSVSVLVLEAGPRDNIFNSRLPSGYGRLFHSKYDWDFYTEPEKELYGRKLPWARGRLLGGCSAINAMMHHRGSPSDFDEWAELVNDSTWTYSNLLPYFKKSETLYPPPDPSTPHATADKDYHGTEGPWQVSWHHFFPISNAFVQACQEMGIPYNPDLNGRQGTMGVNRIQTFIERNGVRSSTARAFLRESDISNRKNLTILHGVHVHKILFERKEGENVPRAVGVEFLDENKESYFVHAKCEIELCAGAIQSPQILNLSGIGNAKDLLPHGIPIVKDLPGVGENLQDHLGVNMIFKTQPQVMTLEKVQWPSQTGKHLYNYLVHGRGPLTTNVGEAAAFLRLEDIHQPSTIKLLADPEYVETASGPRAPHIELISVPVWARAHTAGFAENPPITTPHFTIPILLLNPLSRGRIVLQSKNPLDKPYIYANYLSEEQDRKVFVEAMKFTRKLCRDTVALGKEFLVGEVLPGPSVSEDDDEGFLNFARKNAETYYHPVGTCKMGPANDSMTVVDSDLRVRGVHGLRVVDASIMPKNIAGHPTAVIIAIAEKITDRIKYDREIKLQHPPSRSVEDSWVALDK